jgi:hypothetical protein
MDPNQLPNSHEDAVKDLCHLAGLPLVLSPKKSRMCIPGPHNHCENVSNLKITQYGFRSSLKI